MRFLEEFKHFAIKGSVVDLAVGVIIGAGFQKIVDSIVGDLIMPIIARLFGGLDFSNHYFPLAGQPTGLPLADAKKLGAVLAWGNFVTVAINFVLLAFIIFLMVRAINALRREHEAKEKAAAAPAEPSEEVKLLREIRDELKQR